MAQRIKKALAVLWQVNWIKTFVFNFHYLPTKVAIRIPVFVYRHTRLEELGGRIILDAPIYTGMIKIGRPGMGIIDPVSDRTMWQGGGAGLLVGRGMLHIGSGGRISIGNKGNLTIGNNCTISGRSSIVCHKAITVGDNCTFSWDILIMDTDFHPILNNQGVQINKSAEIIIGNHVWIGCRSTILKGCHIADNTVVAAGSIVTTNLEKSDCVYGGQGRNIYVLKDDIFWKN